MFANVVPARPAADQPVCAIAVDAEEDFDWDLPVAATAYSTDCMRNICDLHEIVGAYGVCPAYLLTYPVLQDDDVVHLLRHQIGRDRCEAGLQLHPWVNPPFDDGAETQEGEATAHALGASYSGNLPAGLEARKLRALKRYYTQRLGSAPTIYRAGRYGLGPDSAALLEAEGFAMDISVAPRTSASEQGGPDFSDYDSAPFWFGQSRRLLEIPLCRSVVGWGGRFAPPVYRALSAPLWRRWRVAGALTRSRFAERITLSPEGNDIGAMLRLLRHLRARGQTVFVLSFHSSSLAVGRNPYVRTRADLHGFYDRLSGVLDAMDSQGFAFTRLSDLPNHLAGPVPG